MTDVLLISGCKVYVCRRDSDRRRSGAGRGRRRRKPRSLIKGVVWGFFAAFGGGKLLVRGMGAGGQVKDMRGVVFRAAPCSNYEKKSSRMEMF